jgi:hypothetical protein
MTATLTHRQAEIQEKIRRSWLSVPEPVGVLAINDPKAIPLGKALQEGLQQYPRFADFHMKDWRALEMTMTSMQNGSNIVIPIDDEVTWDGGHSEVTRRVWSENLSFFHSTSLLTALRILQSGRVKGSPLTVGDKQCLEHAKLDAWPMGQPPAVLYTAPTDKAALGICDFYISPEWIPTASLGPTGEYLATLRIRGEPKRVRLGTLARSHTNKQHFLWPHELTWSSFLSIRIHRRSHSLHGLRLQRLYMADSTAAREQRKLLKRARWALGHGSSRPNHEQSAVAQHRGYNNRQERRALAKRRKKLDRKRQILLLRHLRSTGSRYESDISSESADEGSVHSV